MNDNFMDFLHFQQLFGRMAYYHKIHAWSIFIANSGQNHHLGSLEAANVNFADIMSLGFFVGFALHQLKKLVLNQHMEYQRTP